MVKELRQQVVAYTWVLDQHIAFPWFFIYRHLQVVPKESSYFIVTSDEQLVDSKQALPKG